MWGRKYHKHVEEGDGHHHLFGVESAHLGTIEDQLNSTRHSIIYTLRNTYGRSEKSVFHFGGKQILSEALILMSVFILKALVIENEENTNNTILADRVGAFGYLI
jgi:hypothetical protein